MRTFKSVTLSAAWVMLLAASSAMAESRTHRLKGDFAFTGSTVCVNSGTNFATTPPTPPSGFNNLVPNPGPVFVNTNSVQGVLTFNGDGTGSSVLHFVSLGNPGFASAFDTSAQFTYSVAADGTLTIDNGPSISDTVAGPNTGQQSRITNVPTFTGHLSSDRKSLTFATFNPGVETVTRLVPAPELVTSVRICHRNRIGIRISRDPGSGHGDDD